MNKFDRIFNFDYNKGVIIPVILSIIFVTSLLVGYYLLSNAPPEGFSSIYIFVIIKRRDK